MNCRMNFLGKILDAILFLMIAAILCWIVVLGVKSLATPKSGDNCEQVAKAKGK